MDQHRHVMHLLPFVERQMTIKKEIARMMDLIRIEKLKADKMDKDIVRALAKKIRSLMEEQEELNIIMSS